MCFKDINDRSQSLLVSYLPKHDSPTQNDGNHTSNPNFNQRGDENEPHNTHPDDVDDDDLTDDNMINNDIMNEETSDDEVKRNNYKEQLKRLKSDNSAAHAGNVSPRWGGDKNASPRNSPKRPRVKPINTANNIIDGEEPLPPSAYTYDMRSGRKILVSQAEYEAEERKRTRAAMGQVVDYDEDALMRGDHTGRRSEGKSDQSRGDGPIKSEWPGKSTSKSVTEWLSKMKK
eukprot:gene37078-45740_t